MQMSATNSTLLANNPVALSSLIFCVIYVAIVLFNLGVLIYKCWAFPYRLRCLRMFMWRDTPPKVRPEQVAAYDEEAQEIVYLRQGEEEMLPLYRKSITDTRRDVHVTRPELRSESLDLEVPRPASVSNVAYREMEQGVEMTNNILIALLFFLIWALFITSMYLEFPAPPVGDNTLFNGQQRNNALGFVAVFTALGGLFHFIIILSTDQFWACAKRCCGG